MQVCVGAFIRDGQGIGLSGGFVALPAVYSVFWSGWSEWSWKTRKCRIVLVVWRRSLDGVPGLLLGRTVEVSRVWRNSTCEWCGVVGIVSGCCLDCGFLWSLRWIGRVCERNHEYFCCSFLSAWRRLWHWKQLSCDSGLSMILKHEPAPLYGPLRSAEKGEHLGPLLCLSGYIMRWLHGGPVLFSRGVSPRRCGHVCVRFLIPRVWMMRWP